MFGRIPLRLALALALVATVSIRAQAPVNVRLATLAPDNSPWTGALRSMGTAWEKATERRVRLTVYAGTIPSESSAIARMAVDGLQAATLMVAGLSEIDEAFNIFGVPFFFESDAELAHVQQKLTPLIRERLQAKKYHLINWGNAGWVQLFSKKPIKNLADLKASKLFTAEGDDRVVQWYKSYGFNPVPLAFNDIPAQLKLRTGMIDAAPSPPQGALLLQFFRDAPYMLQVRVAPLIGATVIADKAWNAISPEDRAKMVDAAQAMENKLMGAAPKIDADDIAAMKSRGLTITDLDPKAAAEFHATAEQMIKSMRGGMVPADVFDMALAERDAFRKSKGK